MTAAPQVTADECTPAAHPGTPLPAARGYAAGKADYLTRLPNIEG
jgi:hypothetical protein